MKIYNSISELIGHTPIIRLNRIMEELKLESEILVKVESFNPGGSAKDRVGYNMIMSAIERGEINKDTTIIESTSGNTGVGLALICAIKGLKLVITMPDSMSLERRRLLKSYGANLVLTEGSLGMKGAIDEAERLHKENPNSIIAGQFENEDNPKAHEKTTALEILEDVTNFDYFVATVGTGGTLTGCAKVIKENLKNVKAVAVEPLASNLLTGGEAHSHKIQGIGANFIPKVLDMSLIDEVIDVSDNDAYFYTKMLARKEGILAGISSGAALCAAIEIAKREKGLRIVVILPDTGERYLSTGLYD